MNTLHSKICAQRAREMLRDPVKLFAKHRQTQTNTRQHRRYIWVNDDMTLIFEVLHQKYNKKAIYT